MRAILILAFSILYAVGPLAGQQLTAPGVTWSDSYSFDRCNKMKIDFYARNNELMRTIKYQTFYNSGGDDSKSNGKETVTTAGGLLVPKHSFAVYMDAPGKGGDMETIFDMSNQVAIQVFASDASEPMYNAGRFKFPEGEGIKKLELTPTEETRTIAGHTCKQFTYKYKSIFGSVWIASDVDLPNDYGIFRAAKMAALHNTLSVPGFVMEMTTEDAKGGKTIMTTVSLESGEKMTITLPRSKMGTALNKVNYFSF
jgi:hypothetical protein